VSEERGSLLYDEPPLVVSPTLAKLIGLNEAIILQQVHYWVVQNVKAGRNLHDGFHWTFNSYPQWQKQFPFWSLATIRRTMASLERSGYLITGAFNKMTGDRSKWYRVDYSRVGVSTPSAHIEHPSAHIDTPSAHIDPTITRDYLQRLPTETSTTEDLMIHALMALPYWKPDSEVDKLWLNEFSIEWPDLSLQHIKECRDFNDGRRARHKGDWKNRLRNWMRINRLKEERQGDESRTRTHKRQPTAAQRSAAVESWGE